MKLFCLTVIFCCIKCFAEDIVLQTTEELGVKVRPERLTNQEYETVDRLNRFGFKSSLSQEEIAFVTNSLPTSKNTIAEAALLAIVVHDIPMPFPADHVMAEIIINGRKKGQPPANFLKRNSYTNDITHFTVNGNTHELDKWGYMFINEGLGRIAAVYFTREMRQGRDVQFNEDEYAFLRYDKLLLKYAKYPESEISKIIIPTIANVTSLTTHEYDLVRILVTYDDINLNMILSTLKSKDVGKYGKIILLEALLGKINSLRNTDREKIWTALQESKYDDYYVDDRVERLKHVLQQSEKEFKKSLKTVLPLDNVTNSEKE